MSAAPAKRSRGTCGFCHMARGRFWLRGGAHSAHPVRNRFSLTGVTRERRRGVAAHGWDPRGAASLGTWDTRRVALKCKGQTLALDAFCSWEGGSLLWLVFSGRAAS